MPAPALHLGAVVMCSHAGQATPVAPFPRVLLSGQPAVTIASPYLIAGCALTGTRGVPVGMQVEEPVIDATGAPPASTRVAPTSHWPVAHGGFGVPVRAQPAITYGDESVTAG